MAHRRLQSSRLALLVGLFSAFCSRPRRVFQPSPLIHRPIRYNRLSIASSLISKPRRTPRCLDALSKDAAALSQVWREAAVSSWAKIERSARDALAEIDAWPRTQSLPDDDSEIHV
jgi:hypothetical protein